MRIGLWKKILVYCGNHTDEIKRKLEEVQTKENSGAIYYCCPDCVNRLSFGDYEKMINKIDDFLSEEQINGCNINLQNKSWVNSKKTKFEITRHDAFFDDMEVSVLNQLEIKKNS